MHKLTAAERPLDNLHTPTARRGERRGTYCMGPRAGHSPEDTDRARPRRARRQYALGGLLLLAALACQPAARDTLGAIGDLKGRPFGIARVGSLDQTMTALVLKASGVNPADVQFVSIGAPSGRAQALAAGQIDATAFSIATFKAIEREPGV